MFATRIHARFASLAIAGTIFLASSPFSLAADSKSVGTGASALLSVAVSGTAPLTYQWQKNGSPISGATANTYRVGWAQTTDAGSYTVTVTNSLGSTLSDLGTLAVSVTPTNDSFANATAFGIPSAIFRGTNISATKEAGEPNHAGVVGGASVWWKWLAPTSGLYSVDTVGSSFDTLLGVYTGTAVSALTTVASDDNSGGGGTSYLSFQAVAGTTYYIAVDGKAGATGLINLQLTTQSDFLTLYSFGTLAGSAGVSGSADATGSAASFKSPSGVAVDGSGNVYVADTLNHKIRKITPGGAAYSLAGTTGVSGNTDGTGTAAKFNSPGGVAVDGSGNVYVADTGNHVIRFITPAGVVTTLAGTAGIPGSTDGVGPAAKFLSPTGVTVDGSGNVYVADSGNNTIRMVTPGGAVTTLAGTAGLPGSANGTGTAARFNNPTGVAVDGAGNIYVADFANSTIRRVAPGNIVSTLAGTAGSPGSANGTGSAALFSGPSGVAVDLAGNVYVCERTADTIRFITTGGVVSTMGGVAGAAGSSNGIGTAARFFSPYGIAVDTTGNVYVADNGYSIIRNTTLTAAAPIFTTQPTNQGAVIGGTVTLTAAGTGWPAAALQWKKNGVNITGANRATLILTNLQATDAGTYTLVATNSAGTATSTSVTVSILVAPVFTTQPLTQRVNTGAPVTFTAVASGSPTPTYQWFKNGVAIAGATNSTLTIASVQPTDAGTYTVVATNSGSSVTSAPAVLTLSTFIPDFNADGMSDLLWQNLLTGDRLVWLMNGTTAFNALELVALSNDWQIAALGDFNADGQPDLVWQNTTTGERLIWLMNGATPFNAFSLGTVSTDWLIVGAGDMNGDGNSDLLWTNTVTGERTIWLMNGTTPGTTVSLGIVPFQVSLAGTGDFNGDGNTDLLWQDTLTGAVTVWLMNGTTHSSTVSLGTVSPQLQIVGTGDYNTDGKPDILWTNRVTGERTVWLMNGTTHTSTVTLTTLPLNWVLMHPVAQRVWADFNSDGKSDLIWQNTATGDRLIFQMNGVTPITAVPIGSGNYPVQQQIAATGDFNADGKADLVWQNTTTGDRYVWLMSGNTMASSVDLGIMSTDWSIVGTGDFNADGYSDLIWKNNVTGEYLIWLMNGTTPINSISLGVLNTQWQLAATGDFNLDGNTDIVWQNTVTGDRFVWLMNGTTMSSTVDLGVVSTDWSIAGTGDFNGDGQIDLVWQNTVTGERLIWLMYGTVPFNSFSLGIYSTDWTIRN